MKPIDLSRWHRRATIGTAGDVRLAGDGVEARHAEIVLRRNGDGHPVPFVRPLQGRVKVQRRSRELAVLGEWQLADNDVLIIGDRRLIYRNLGCRPKAGAEEGAVTWLS